MVTKAEVCTKILVERRDAMKSELFTTINGVFCRFCASETCYYSQHAAFWAEW